jgi:transposase InsO family protein
MLFVGWQLCHGLGGRIRVESVAALLWNGRQLSSGISGRIRVESVAGLLWNQWQDSRGIGGSFRVEYALQAEGLAVGRVKARRLMKEAGVRGQRAKRRAPVPPDSRHGTRQEARDDLIE